MLHSSCFGVTKITRILAAVLKQGNRKRTFGISCEQFVYQNEGWTQEEIKQYHWEPLKPKHTTNAVQTLPLRRRQGPYTILNTWESSWQRILGSVVFRYIAFQYRGEYKLPFFWMFFHLPPFFSLWHFVPIFCLCDGMHSSFKAVWVSCKYLNLSNIRNACMSYS